MDKSSSREARPMGDVGEVISAVADTPEQALVDKESVRDSRTELFYCQGIG